MRATRINKVTTNFQLRKDEVRTPWTGDDTVGGGVTAGYKTTSGTAASGGPQAMG